MVMVIDPMGGAPMEPAYGQDYVVAHRGSTFQTDRSKIMDALQGAGGTSAIAPPPIDPAIEMIDTGQTPLTLAAPDATDTTDTTPATITPGPATHYKLIDLGDGLFTTQERLMAAAGQWLDAARPTFPLEVGGTVVRQVELVLSADGTGFALALVQEGT